MITRRGFFGALLGVGVLPTIASAVPTYTSGYLQALPGDSRYVVRGVLRRADVPLKVNYVETTNFTPMAIVSESGPELMQVGKLTARITVDTTHLDVAIVRAQAILDEAIAKTAQTCRVQSGPSIS